MLSSRISTSKTMCNLGVWLPSSDRYTSADVNWGGASFPFTRACDRTAGSASWMLVHQVSMEQEE